MLAAMLPALLFFDHWTVRVQIPGTDSYFGMPAARGHSHGGEDSHSSHCHESVATCSDTGVAAGATMAVLAGVLVITLGGLRHRCRLPLAIRSGEDSKGPEPRPPRGSAVPGALLMPT
jgi:hypothetical protein